MDCLKQPFMFEFHRQTQSKYETETDYPAIEFHYPDSSEWSPSTSAPVSDPSSIEIVTLKPTRSNRPVRNICPAKCAICGDQAAGYHYEVASCNGCKTFFRRTIMTNRLYQCKRERNCYDIFPIENRCRSCRFDRCITAGMNPLAIQLTPEQQEFEVVKEAVSKRASSSSSVHGTNNKVVPTRMVTLQTKIGRIIDELTYLEFKTGKFRFCKYNPDIDTSPDIEFIIKQTCSLDLAERLGPMPDWPLPEPKMDGSVVYGENRKSWLLYELLTSIEYAKTFPFFHKLTINDRKILIRNVSLMTTNLTVSFNSYKQKSPDVLHADGTRPLLYMNPEKFALQQVHRRCLNALIRDGISEKEYVILKAVILCNAGSLYLSPEGKVLVLKEQKRLIDALCQYCLNEFGPFGPSRFTSNIALVDLLEHMARDQRDVHLLRNIQTPSKNAKFVSEIFEL